MEKFKFRDIFLFVAASMISFIGFWRGRSDTVPSCPPPNGGHPPLPLMFADTGGIQDMLGLPGSEAPDAGWAEREAAREKPAVIEFAHRTYGGHDSCAGVAENGLQGILLAAERGAVAEFDLRKIRRMPGSPPGSGLVLHHDAGLGIRSNRSGYVRPLFEEELPGVLLLDGEEPEPMVSLRQVFAALAEQELRVQMAIEPKGSFSERREIVEELAPFLQDQVENHGWSYDDFLVIAESPRLMQAIREVNPDIRVSLTLHRAQHLAFIESARPDALTVKRQVLDDVVGDDGQMLAEWIEEQRIPLYVWNIKSVAQATEVLERFPQTDGLIVSDPGTVEAAWVQVHGEQIAQAPAVISGR